MKEPTLHILAVPGSLRKSSYNRFLLEASVELAAPGMSITVFDGLDSVPVFNEDLEHPSPAGVARLREALATSDGVLIATPEYNQSVPGVIKNMIDWISRSEEGAGLEGRPVAVTGVTTGPWGTRIAQTQLRQMLLSAQALLLPQPMLFVKEAALLFDEDGTLRDRETSARLRQLLEAFSDWIRLNRKTSVPESGKGVEAGRLEDPTSYLLAT